MVQAYGRNAVRVRVVSDVDTPVEFVAPAVTEEWLAGHVRLPHDVSALSAGGKVEASCDAVAADDRRQRWSAIPIKVSVTFAGFAPIEFVRRVEDAPPKPVVLERP